MVERVLVGGISPEGEHILRSYLEAFAPEAVIEPLKAVGIKGKIKNHVPRMDVLFAIVDEGLVQACAGVVDDILASPKVHKYMTDDGLTQFLISKFGKLDDAKLMSSTPPPDQLLNQAASEDAYIPKANSFGSGSSAPPDRLSSDMVHSVSEAEDFSMGMDYQVPTQDMSEEVRELKQRLSAKETEIRNLTLQLSDKASGSDEDIKVLASRIKELESELEKKNKELADAENNSFVDAGKVAMADKLIAESNTIKQQLTDTRAELKSALDEKASLEYERNKLTQEVEELNKRIEGLLSQGDDLEAVKAQLEEKQAEVDKLSDELDEKEAELLQTRQELESNRAEVGVVQAELDKANELQASYDTLEDNLKAKELELNNLQVDYDTMKKKLEDALSGMDEADNDLRAKIEQMSQKDAELADLRARTSEYEIKVAELTATVNDLNEDLEAKKKELVSAVQREEKYRADIELLRSDSDMLSNKDAELEMLTANLDEQRALVSNLNNSIAELKGQLRDKDTELKTLNEQVLFARDEAEVNKEAYDKALADKAKSDSQLDEREAEVSSLTAKLTSTTEQLDLKRREYSELAEKNLESTSKISKLENTIQTLQNELVEAKTNETALSNLEQDLLEERRKSARLASEVEVYKKSDDSSKTSELRAEVTRLRDELAKAKSGSGDKVDSKELELVRKELAETKERCTNLELDMVDKEEQVRELSEGVFARMANISIPKGLYDVELPALSGNFEKFVCIAGGSEESTVALYQTLRKACEAEPQKRILFLDLVTDSRVDMEFGVVKVVSPIGWLSGSDGFDNYLAATKFNHVRVLSTALAYLNDLFLLNVNWQSRLMDIANYSDIVIVNIGCLNNVTTKALFNTFSKVMKTYVITKATPINLRAVILNLTGLTIQPTVTTVCVNFDDRASRNMYQRLTQKFKAQILLDSDVLKF